MEIELYNKHDKKNVYVSVYEGVHGMYYQRYIFPTDQDTTIQRNAISTFEGLLPLYDPYTKNMYIIPKDEVFNKVIYSNYRVCDAKQINVLKKYKKKLEEEESKRELNVMEKRNLKKLRLMLIFLSNYDINLLEKTYNSIMYSEYGKDITICLKPSFQPHFTHIKPYYTRDEIINLALNMELIEPNNMDYKDNALKELCKKIIVNDINSDILESHLQYIMDNQRVGLLEYYTMQGSYFINMYLRKLMYNKRNYVLETVSQSMYDIVRNSPAFDKDYIVYRFVSDDSFLRKYKVGDIFQDKGFISTTRNPFYRPSTFDFGNILLKIKIPQGMSGVGLCVETISKFQEEQEIILPPNVQLRLDYKNKNCMYYHIDSVFSNSIKTKYEFTIVGHDDIDIPQYKEPTIETIDFFAIKKLKSESLDAKLKYFVKHFVSDVFLIKSKIGNTEFPILIEWFDSTDVYKKFHALTSRDGFMMYSFMNNQLLFTIEIGEVNKKPMMFVNYQFKFLLVNDNNYYSNEEFMTFICSIALYFDIKKLKLFSNYNSCPKQNNRHDGSYSIDIYQYLKYNKKIYDKFIASIRPAFDYYQLDRLRQINPKNMLEQNKDELYVIYKDSFLTSIGDESKDNLRDFYLWLIDNNCYLINSLTDKMQYIFKNDNPFKKNDYYLVNVNAFLFSQNLINSYEEDTTEHSYMPKNMYRIGFNEIDNKLPPTRIQK